MVKVSILCITYNQEKFIRQALESFMAQITNFDFEVIVGDDCSTDGTRKILREFELKYPGTIKPIFREKNIGAIQNFMDLFYRANGEYIALCEGDDFFSDENKLQLQVDFLDNNMNHTVCFHPVRVFFENNEEEDFIFPEVNSTSKFQIKELLNQNFIQTNSVMYRKQKYENLPVNILPGDWYMHLYHAKFGEIGFINKTMSSYRRHCGGIWWDSYNNQTDLLKKHGIRILFMYFQLLKLCENNFKHRGIIFKKICSVFDGFDGIYKKDRKEKNKIIKMLFLEFPDDMAEFSIWQFDKLSKTIKEKEQEIRERNSELFDIRSSLRWKIPNYIYKLYKKSVKKYVPKIIFRAKDACIHLLKNI